MLNEHLLKKLDKLEEKLKIAKSFVLYPVWGIDSLVPKAITKSDPSIAKFEARSPKIPILPT